jgi:predicted ATPase
MTNSDSTTNTNYPRLLSFTLDGWDVLGGRVTVSLQDGVAVLVGRNGAGKSAILEGFEIISSWAIGRRSQILQTNTPKTFEIEISTPTARRLRYKYELLILPSSTEAFDSDIPISYNLESWNDCCQYMDHQQEILWSTENGETILKDSNDSTTTILGINNSFSRINHLNKSRLKLPIEFNWTHDVLKGICMSDKNPFDSKLGRSPSMLVVSPEGIKRHAGSEGQTFILAQKIYRYYTKNHNLDELENICQRIGIANKIKIDEYDPKLGNLSEEKFVFVIVDDVNIGLLSEGTLRVMSILIEILSLSTSSTIIIEEPETQIHPAMLSRLLNEIEAYTYGENLILSTHSPQVVSWTDPEKIHLVHRNDGQTFVRKLIGDEIHRVIEYLSEEGTLGEWIYSGALNE